MTGVTHPSESYATRYFSNAVSEFTLSMPDPKHSSDSSQDSGSTGQFIDWLTNDWLVNLNQDLKHHMRPSFQPARLDRESLLKKREKEFALGRVCAESQLLLLGENGSVGVNDDRSPSWPNGFTGSITHSQNWTWATVASTDTTRSIGIDTEKIVDAKVRREVQNQIVNPAEWDQILRNDADPDALFSAVFSAKESVYKCCFPIVRQYFGFQCAVVESMGAEYFDFRLT
ncbi:MAG: 4'-phosphopantetheinyl transferase superfamily protein, partial [Planctomycetota bacterium]